MDEIEPQTALALLRMVPGRARVLVQTFVGSDSPDAAGLLIQFDNGIEIRWTYECRETVEVLPSDADAPQREWSFRLRTGKTWGDPIASAVTGDHKRRLRDLERKVHQLERNLMSQQGQVGALETAVAQVATDLATAQTTLQTELDALAAANPGVDLSKLTTAVDALDPAVQALAALKPDAPAQPTSETVSVPIGASGEGSIQIPHPVAQVTITTQPTTGTASLEAVAVEGQPNATKLLVVGATPETTESVVISIAA